MADTFGGKRQIKIQYLQYLQGSESIHQHQHAEKNRKTLLSTILLHLLTFYIWGLMKMYMYLRYLKCRITKIKNTFLLASWRPQKKRAETEAGSGSVSNGSRTLKLPNFHVHYNSLLLWSCTCAWTYSLRTTVWTGSCIATCRFLFKKRGHELNEPADVCFRGWYPVMRWEWDKSDKMNFCCQKTVFWTTFYSKRMPQKIPD